MRTFLLMKNGRYAKDYTEGTKLTSKFNEAEKFTTIEAANKAVKEYGKEYKVVCL
jgi:hypothetical protein